MKSNSKIIGKVKVPSYKGLIYMEKFNLRTLDGVPEMFKEAVSDMTYFLENGEAFLTVDGKLIEKGDKHRRGDPHMDGIWMESGWDVPSRWNMMHGTPDPSHIIDPFEVNGGIILASDYTACKGWNGEYNDLPGDGGDCSHFNLKEGFLLEKDTVYYANSTFIHESLPVENDVHRTLLRVSLPESFKYNY